MSRHWLTLVVVTVVSGTRLVAQEAAQPFWSAPPSQMDLSNLSPAAVELVATPDISRPLATFVHEGQVMPANFVPQGEAVRPYIPTNTSPWAVLEQGLEVGAAPYGDRKYVIEELPDNFAGLTLLRTQMGQKAIVDARYFARLSIPQPTSVFLAIDERIIEIYKQFGTPLWLEGFAPTAHTLRTDEPVMKRDEKVYRVFVKQVAPGTLTLGPACTRPNDSSMYFAFFAAAE